MAFWAGVKAAITGAGKTGDVIDTGLGLMESGAKGIDAMFYTKEEKARAMAENAGAIITHATKMNELMNQSNTLSSQIRRTLAYWISGVALGTFVWCVIVLSYAYFWSKQPETIKLTQAFIKVVVQVSEALYVGPAFTAVVILFFGYYGLSKIVGKAKGGN